MAQPKNRSLAAAIAAAAPFWKWRSRWALLLNLTFGMVEFGYFFYVKNAFENAASEGVGREWCRAPPTAIVTTAVTARLSEASSSPSG